MLEVRPFSFRDRLFRQLVDRRDNRDPAVLQQAVDAVAAIESGGGEALLAQARLHDSPNIGPENMRVSEEEIAQSRGMVSEPFLTALSLSRVNIRKFHEYQRRRGFVHDDDDGVRLTRQVRPLARVGILCRESCTSLLMCAVPAQVAGVGQIALAAAPRKDGTLAPTILATAKILGIDEVYRLSGAHAVAAFAYGASPVGRVDKIVGPGCQRAETAKRLVNDRVGVDRTYCQSELVIVSDATANAKFIAADMLAQAAIEGEAGVLALFTTDRLLAEAVRIEIDRLAETLADGPLRRDTLARQGGLFVCPDLTVAIEAANAIAPSRLGIMTRDNEGLLTQVENAGSVFLGPWSTEAASGGFSGANGLVPPLGRSRFDSGLGVDDFIQEMTVVDYSQERLTITGRHMLELAMADGRIAHAEALRQRLDLLRWTSE